MAVFFVCLFLFGVLFFLFVWVWGFLFVFGFCFVNFCSGSLTFNVHSSSASIPAFLTSHFISPYYFTNFSPAFLKAISTKGFGRLLYFLLISLYSLFEEKPHSFEEKKRQSSQPPKYGRSA